MMPTSHCNCGASSPALTRVEHEDAVLGDDALDVLQVDDQRALAGQYGRRVRRRQLRVQQTQVPQLQGSTSMAMRSTAQRTSERLAEDRATGQIHPKLSIVDLGRAQLSRLRWVGSAQVCPPITLKVKMTLHEHQGAAQQCQAGRIVVLQARGRHSSQHHCTEQHASACHASVSATCTCTPVSSVMLYLSACRVPQRPLASKRSHLRTPGTLRFVRSMRSRNGALH